MFFEGLGKWLWMRLELESEYFGNKLLLFEVGLEVTVGLTNITDTMRRRYGKDVPK